MNTAPNISKPKFEFCVPYPVRIINTFNKEYAATVPDFPMIQGITSATKNGIIQLAKSAILAQISHSFEHGNVLPKPSWHLIENRNYALIRIFFNAKWDNG